MKNRVPILAPLTLTVLISGVTVAFEQPDPGPEDAGLRLRLVVLPHPKADREGYDVRVDVLNTTKADIMLRAGWWYDTDKGDAKDYIEASTSIETYPAIAPWVGQVGAKHRTLPQPDYGLKAGEKLVVGWHHDVPCLK